MRSVQHDKVEPLLTTARFGTEVANKGARATATHDHCTVRVIGERRRGHGWSRS
jgi:hypothetical protein